MDRLNSGVSLAPMELSEGFRPKKFPSVQQILSSLIITATQFSSVAQSCLTLYHPMNRSTPGLLVHHQLLESTQTHVH